MNNNPARNRIIAFAFLACFIVLSILSNMFFIDHFEHEHDHNGVNGGCATCATIQITENILKQLSIFFIGALFTIALLYSAIKILKAANNYFLSSTPVMLKSRMNN